MPKRRRHTPPPPPTLSEILYDVVDEAQDRLEDVVTDFLNRFAGARVNVNPPPPRKREPQPKHAFDDPPRARKPKAAQTPKNHVYTQLLRTHYDTLQVSRFASTDIINAAFRTLARIYHPDTHPGDTVAEESFKKITEARDVLVDEEKRKRYDRSIGL